MIRGRPSEPECMCVRVHVCVRVRVHVYVCVRVRECACASACVGSWLLGGRWILNVSLENAGERIRQFRLQLSGEKF